MEAFHSEGYNVQFSFGISVSRVVLNSNNFCLMNYKMIEKVRFTYPPINPCGMPLFYMKDPGNLRFKNKSLPKDLSMQWQLLPPLHG